MKKKKQSDEMAVVYARYSSHNQQEQSIEGQIAAAQRYAKSKGYTIIREYCDRAKTGTNDNREEFQRMLSDCAKKQFSVIIVWKVDRFGRNREEITFNKYRAKKHGVRVEYVAENVGEGPESIILESVLEGMAEYYSVQLSQNVQRGMLESAKKHKVLGGWVCFGYKVGPERDFEIDPETAPVVKKIFDMYVGGSTISELTTYLNNKGYRTSKGRPFNKNSLPRILKNEKYIGTYVYKDLIRDEDAIPAIIDKETFAKVQELLKYNRRKPSRKWSFSDYLLSDKLICGKCGSPMHGKSAYGKLKKKYNYYVCKNCIDGQTHCDLKPIRQEILEAIVLAKIEEIVFNDHMIEFITDAVWETYCKDDTRLGETKTVKNRIKEVQKSMANLMKSIEAGLFNDMIRNRMEELQAEENILKAELANLELANPLKLTRDHILYYLSRYKEMDLKDLESRKRIISTFVNSIFVYDDHIVITFNYSGDNNRVTINDYNTAQNKADSETGCALSKNAQPVFDRVSVSGPGGNRTRVRKSVPEGVFHHSLYLDIPSIRRLKTNS